MKERLVDLLACPACGGALTLSATEGAGGEVREGSLACAACPHLFPIRRGIPRLLLGGLAVEQERTAAAFGWEWQEFHQLHSADRTREQFLDWIVPLGPADFAGKVVLDAGCGMGRFAAVARSFGAREVLACDLSDAVEAAARNLAGVDNAHVIQADLHRLPLPRRGGTRAPVVDLAYCIGVLHHLPVPEQGFHALATHLKDDGALFAWVYGREHNGWLVHLVNPVREAVSSRLPRRLLYALSWLFTVKLQVALKLLYLPAERMAALRWLRPLLPYRAYLTWLSGFGFRHNHHVVFDHLVAPTAFYIRREEFAAWFDRYGFGQVTLTPRNQNSWRGLGQGIGRPAARSGDGG